MEEKHLKTNIAQYALIISNKKMLVLWPNGENEPLWVLPGGRLNEDDENYEKALKREAMEEIGQDIEVVEPFYVDMYHVHGKKHRYAVFFLCNLKNKEIKLSKDHHKCEWLNYDDLMKFVEKYPERARAGIILVKRLKERKLL